MEEEKVLEPIIFTHEEFGTVRMLGDWDNPEFCLADLCRYLELDASQVMKRLDGGVVSIHPISDSLGRTQKANFVNEDGLYDVILDSRKPSAKKFRKWITSEVLPALRKTGSYTMPGNDDAKTVNIYFGGFGNMSEDSSEKWLKEKSGENLVRLAKLLGSKDLTADQEYVLKKAFWFLTGEQFPVQKEKQQE